MPQSKGRRGRAPKPRNIRIDVFKCRIPVTDQRDGSIEYPLVIMVLEGEALLKVRVAFDKDLTERGELDA